LLLINFKLTFGKSRVFQDHLKINRCNYCCCILIANYRSVETLGLLKLTDEARFFARHAAKPLIYDVAFTVFRYNLFPSETSSFVSGASD
jgi:hypothetical protein